MAQRGSEQIEGDARFERDFVALAIFQFLAEFLPGLKPPPPSGSYRDAGILQVLLVSCLKDLL